MSSQSCVALPTSSQPTKKMTSMVPCEFDYTISDLGVFLNVKRMKIRTLVKHLLKKKPRNFIV
jgi:hypothetical protein